MAIQSGLCMSKLVEVHEYFMGKPGPIKQFETLDEAHAFISKQGDEPGVEWLVIPNE